MNNLPAPISEAIRALCGVCLPRLHRIKHSDDSSKFTKYVGVSQSESTRSPRTEITQIFDHGYLIAAAFEHIVAMPEYIAASDALLANEVIGNQLNAMHGTRFFGLVRLTSSGVLRGFLTELVARAGDFVFNEESFAGLGNELWMYFADDEIPFVSRAPSLQFSTDATEVDFGDGVRIVPGPTKAEEDLRYASPGGVLTTILLHPTTRLLEVTFLARKMIRRDNDPDDAEGAPDPAKPIMAQAVSTLRLLKRGGVEVGYRQTSSAHWIPSIRSQGQLRMEAGHPVVGVGYRLEVDEIPKVIDLWRHRRHEAQSMAKSRFYDVALGRFNASYERESAADRVIDLMIAFEALYLGDAEPAELSYRLAIRAAVLLGTTRDERQDVFASIRAAYGLRSSVVHGRSPAERVIVSGETLHIGEFVFRIENLLRQSLIKFSQLLTGTSGQAILKDLDSRIFS